MYNLAHSQVEKSYGVFIRTLLVHYFLTILHQFITFCCPLDPEETDFVLTKDLQKQIIIENTVNSNVSNYNLGHGDRLFLHYNRNISPTTSNNGNEISTDKVAQYDSKGLFFSHMPEFISTLLYFCRVVRHRLPEHG